MQNVRIVGVCFRRLSLDLYTNYFAYLVTEICKFTDKSKQERNYFLREPAKLFKILSHDLHYFKQMLNVLCCRVKL